MLKYYLFRFKPLYDVDSIDVYSICVYSIGVYSVDVYSTLIPH